MRSCSLKFYLLLLMIVSTTSCYEGWDDEVIVENGGNKNPDTGNGTKKFFYILWEHFSLSDAAVQDSGCFANSGIEDFRIAEWNLRKKSLRAALAAATETFIEVTHSLGTDDCDGLTTVESAAINSEPWSPDEAPGIDDLDRLSLHIKGVFWDSDASATPSASVKKVNWLAFSNLVDAGRSARSVHHFVLEEPTSQGFFKNWHDALASSSVFDATPITDVDPSPDGISARKTTVDSDAKSFMNWLLDLD